MNGKKTLGWREWIGFPEFNIPRIKAKIDTGARTSALHAFSLTPFMRDEKPWVRFAIHPKQGNTENVVECEAPVKEQRVVRDSGGHEELRYVIDTLIRIGDDVIRSEVTLTDRDSMTFRVLLGRTALRDNYVIYPDGSYLQSKARTRVKARNQSTNESQT
ncbi:MAG: ATP-dependent zinc protease [Haliea sp.]|nr:ATP-dependent zinc protease [Haliea sp.]